MLIIYLIFLFVFLIALTYNVALKTKFIFNTETDEMKLSFFWIYPLLKANVIMKDKKPLLTVFLFNKVIFKKVLQTKAKKRTRVRFSLGNVLVKSAKLKDFEVTANYGFVDKFTTGITCGAVNFASQLAGIDRFNHYPDFLSTKDYIYVSAKVDVLIFTTLMNFIRAKTRRL